MDVLNKPRNARCCDNYSKLFQICQVIAAVEERNRVIRLREHLKKRGADEFAAADNGDVFMREVDIVAG